MRQFIISFLKEEDGLGTVEVVVIIAVLVGIALIFRKAIFSYVNQILDTIFNSTGNVVNIPSGADTQTRTIN